MDSSVPRTTAFIKRLLQVMAHTEPTFTCGGLVLVSKLLKERPSLRTLLTQPEDGDSDEEHFVDADKPASAPPTLPKDSYDPSKRNPSFANATKSCLWELVSPSESLSPTGGIDETLPSFSRKVCRVN